MHLTPSACLLARLVTVVVLSVLSRHLLGIPFHASVEFSTPTTSPLPAVNITFCDFLAVNLVSYTKQEAQLMLTTGSTRLAVSRGQQTWYHSTCNI